MATEVCFSLHHRRAEIAKALARCWVNSDASIKHEEQLVFLNVRAIHDFLFPNSVPFDPECPSFRYLIEHLVVGSFGWGISSGGGFDTDPRARLLTFFLRSAMQSNYSKAFFDISGSSFHFVLQHPQEAGWIFRLLMKHSSCVRKALLRTGISTDIELSRGQKSGYGVKILESWTSGLEMSLSTYGDIRLDAVVPLRNIFSIRDEGIPECEFIVSRIDLVKFSRTFVTDPPSWEAKSGHSKDEKWLKTVRIAAADVLERVANLLRE